MRLVFTFLFTISLFGQTAKMTQDQFTAALKQNEQRTAAMVANMKAQIAALQRQVAADQQVIAQYQGGCATIPQDWIDTLAKWAADLDAAGVADLHVPPDSSMLVAVREGADIKLVGYVRKDADVQPIEPQTQPAK